MNKHSEDAIFWLLVLLWSLFFIAIANAMPNQAAWDILVQNWGKVKSVESKVFDPNVQEKHIFTVWPCYDTTKDDYLVIRCKDPNDYLEVTSFHRNRFDYSDFAIYARQFKPDPNEVFVRPTCWAEEPNEPNLLEIFSEIAEPNVYDDPNSILSGLLKLLNDPNIVS